MRSRLLAFAVGALVAWATPVLAKDDSTFRFRLTADPSTLDWTQASTSFETYALMNIMEGLVEIDRNLTAGPRLADSWDISKDGLTYTFHLRPGVKWSDGVALKAGDFVTSWRRLLEPGTRNDYASFLFEVEHAEDFHLGRLHDFAKVGVKALDSEHLQVRLRRVTPYFITLLSFWVTFPQREDLVKKKGWDLPPRLVVLGPYTISRWEKGKELVFERNPGYYGPKPPVSKVVGVIEPDNDKARHLLFDGKIDALLEVSTEDMLDFTPGSGKQLKQFDYLATLFLAFNVKSAGLGNTELRRAIAQAIDRSGIPSALKGGQVPADSLIPRGIVGYEPNALAYSPEQARLSLVAAGYNNASKVPPLSILCIQGRTRPAAEYVRQALRAALDLDVEIKAVSPSEYSRLRKSGRYQLAIAQWGLDYPDAASLMELFLSDSTINYTGWSNVQYDRLVQSAGGSLKLLERIRAYSEAQRLLTQAEAVVVPLYYPKLTALLSSDIANFEITPLNYLFFSKIIPK